MIRVAEGVYVETRFKGGNVGLIDTEEGLLLVDIPPNPADVKLWQHQVMEVGNKPILYAINTDDHPLRVMSNNLLKVPKIAHQAVWEDLATPKAPYRQIFREFYKAYRDQEPPDNFGDLMPAMAFSRRMSLYKGRRLIRLIALGGTTPASIVVHIPGEKLLFTGALVVTNTHPDLCMADSAQWLEALAYIKKLSVKLIIPGSGNPCGKEAVDKVAEYIRKARAAVKDIYKAGKSRSEVAKLVNDFLPLFPVSPQSENEIKALIKTGLSHIYDEFKAG
ncbi:MAG: hypothetical protein DRI61_01810 [Chloroflexi bacterium]|nr:MAG: hypothetical protein DRI61_01810 [Chloroflexota bacterium]